MTPHLLTLTLGLRVGDLLHELPCDSLSRCMDFFIHFLTKER